MFAVRFFEYCKRAKIDFNMSQIVPYLYQSNTITINALIALGYGHTTFKIVTLKTNTSYCCVQG